jgi:hypothetical protein
MKSFITIFIGTVLMAMPIGIPLAASSADNRWVNRRDIKTIRKIYREIETSIENGETKKTQAPEHCFREQSALTEAYLVTDNDNVIRKLFVAYGTEDSLGWMAYYYDADGAHRFTFQSVGAVNGTQQERRIYFDKTGDEIHSDNRILAGPGYPTEIKRYVPQPEAYLKSLCGIN